MAQPTMHSMDIMEFIENAFNHFHQEGHKVGWIRNFAPKITVVFREIFILFREI
jgi:hypothetical protein